jgi:hypothetical protein
MLELVEDRLLIVARVCKDVVIVLTKRTGALCREPLGLPRRKSRPFASLRMTSVFRKRGENENCELRTEN